MHNFTTRRALARTLVLLAGMAGVTAASAQTIDVTGAQRLGAETRSIQVGFGDLNLNADQGRDRLDRRIRWAAGAVCGSKPMKGLEKRNDHSACTMAAITGAEAQVQAITATAVAGGGGVN